MLASLPHRTHCLLAGLNQHKTAATLERRNERGDENRDMERRERLGKERGMWRGKMNVEKREKRGKERDVERKDEHVEERGMC